MMEHDDQRELDRLLDGLDPPLPPADLRARALGVARERLAETPKPDLWSRIWNSRGLRFAWAATVALLLAGHLVTSPRLGSAVGPHPPRSAESQRDEQFLEILRPVRIDADAHPAIGRFAAAGDLTQIENGGNPS